MVEFSICSQGMGEDNPGDPTEDTVAIPTSTVRSSKELGASPSSTKGERSTIESSLSSSPCPLDGYGGSAKIDGNIASSS
jgi:hypothetical protein